MEIIYKKLSELRPYKNNPRKNINAIPFVTESIRNFGFRNPIIIDKNNVIVCGHTRLASAKELGLEEVPCIVADDLSDEQVKAFRLADNKVAEMAEWDYDLLNMELDDIVGIDMEDFGFLDNNIDWDNVDELNEENYEEPGHNMLECPKCHHIDRDIHFKKVGVETEENQNNNE